MLNPLTIKSSACRTAIGIIVAAAIALSWSVALAVVPTSVTHQGRLTDTSGEPETGEVDLNFTIYDAASGGDILWQQELSNVDLGDDGFYSIELGGDANPIDAVILQDGSAYLAMSIDGGEELSPRLALNTVPYAAVADHAETASHIEGMANIRGMTMFDAVDSQGGVIGESRSTDSAYRGQSHFVGASDDDATGDVAAWSLDSDTVGNDLAIGHTALRTRLQVANNSVGGRLATVECAAERNGSWQILNSIEVHPQDFGGDDEWLEFLIHCDFLPDDANQRIAIADFEPGLTDLRIDYVRLKPLPEMSFVSSRMIMEDSVTGHELADNAVDTQHLVNSSVTGQKIANNTVDSQHISGDSITGQQLANSAVDSQHISNNSVRGQELANDAVDTEHLSTDSVTGQALANNSVDTQHLSTNSVTSSEISANSVTSSEIRANAVGPSELDDAINVYDAPPGCGKSGLVLDTSCGTVQCSSSGCGIQNSQPCYYNCSGFCPTGFSGNNSSVSCNTDFVGYLMGADAN